MKPTKKKLILRTKNKLINWIHSTWSFLLSVLFGLSFLFILQHCYYCGCIKKQNTMEAIELIALLSSIIAGIVIAFLAAKIIQIRQEKIALKPGLWELTRKLHYFRKIIREIYNNDDFWPNGLPNYIRQNYSDLSYYDVRDIIDVYKKTTKEASKFIQDENFGEIKKQAYLEMKSFFLPERIFDETVSSEFDVDLMYPSRILDKWEEYDCGNMIWYLFDNNYVLYVGQFNFNSFRISKQKEIEVLSKKIDKERYKNIEFGPLLLGKLGSQIYLDIIPQLNRLQHAFEQGLPSIVKFMYSIISLMLVFGVILPVIIKLFDFPIVISFISIVTVLSMTIHFIFRLPSIMKREIYIE